MDSPRRPRFDALRVAASVIGVVTVVWMAPLMTDQLIFSADPQETGQAEMARLLMLPAALVQLAAAAVVRARGVPRFAALAALPALIAVPVAFLVPDTGYQLVAFAFTAPLSIGGFVIGGMRSPERRRPGSGELALD